MPSIIYHNNCTDGFCAAWLFYQVYPDAEFIPANHGDSPPNVDGKDVVIVDFSYPRDVLLEMKEKANSLLVLDHHKTAKANCEGLDFCIFDMKESGASLAFAHLRDKFEEPEVHLYEQLVLYVKDRDLWNWELDYSKEVSAAINSYPKNFDAWDDLAFTSLSDLIQDGAAIQRYRKQLIDSNIKNAAIKNICGYKVWCAPCFGDIISEVGEELAKRGAFGATFYDRASDSKRVFSLRSIGDFDVSEIAKQYGGGGHKNAAGFEINYVSSNI